MDTTQVDITTELPSLDVLADLALSLGWVPIPIVGKRPILPRWQTITRQTARAKMAHAVATNTANNIGILTGEPSGIIVVDVDVAKGGLVFWETLLQEHVMPETVTVRTGGGGLHLYFRLDDRTRHLRNATGAIKKVGIDVKTTGGQVVGVGSIHETTGVMYDYIGGITPDGNIILSPMPDWLLQLLQTNQDQLNARYSRKYA